MGLNMVTEIVGGGFPALAEDSAAVSGAFAAPRTVTHLEIRAGGACESMLASAAAMLGTLTALRTVDFVLDEDADACAFLAGRATSLTQILTLSRSLKSAGVAVRWHVPLLPRLVYRLEAIFSLAQDEGVEPMVAPGTDGRPRADLLDADGLLFARDFVSYRLNQKPDVLTSGAPVHTAVMVMEVDARGSQWTLRRVTRQTAAAVAARSASETPRQEIATVLAEGVRAVVEWGKARATRSGASRQTSVTRSLPRVLLIGAYGGEHIGDAAILGGVLLRIHRRYGTRSAVLVSQRPDHTRHLVPMLDTPVQVRVEEYRQSTVRGLLDEVDGVVFAGGPLMDLPMQLVKHLYAVSLARGTEKPFVVEGIGAGPFVRRPSFWTARRLVLMAERVSVRTADDGRAPLVRGVEPEIGRDPAFDYLETRGTELTRLPETDRLWVERLLADTAGRVTVGLNLRPIRPDYTTDVSRDRRVEYTRFVEGRFEERLADAMRQFHMASKRPPCFVFFPMNAVQFGLSDLRSAYRVQRLLRGDVDFRVWEGDASIDGIVALLRRLDVAVTMRFHATIYALAQQRPVIGIDYRVGRRDKVAALLGDFGQSHNCARIDEMTSDWLFQRLCSLSARGAS